MYFKHIYYSKYGNFAMLFQTFLYKISQKNYNTKNIDILLNEMILKDYSEELLLDEWTPVTS